MKPPGRCLTFDEAMDYSLEKNAELMQRLAKHERRERRIKKYFTLPLVFWIEVTLRMTFIGACCVLGDWLGRMMR